MYVGQISRHELEIVMSESSPSYLAQDQITLKQEAFSSRVLLLFPKEHDYSISIVPGGLLVTVHSALARYIQRKHVFCFTLTVIVDSTNAIHLIYYPSHHPLQERPLKLERICRHEIRRLHCP